MRARRVGNRSEFRLFQNEREIGYVTGSAVGLQGFATRDDAKAAAVLASRALSRRRKQAAQRLIDPDDVLVLSDQSVEFVVARAGVLARLLPPSSGRPETGWGFEVQLLPGEAFEVFAVARARVLWRAIQRSSLRRRMLQFQQGSERTAATT